MYSVMAAGADAAPHSARHNLQSRLAQLHSERQSWLLHWQDISRHLLPRSGRFLANEKNRGDKRHHAIIDSTATRALRILAAGMMAGMTSPARPWFRLTTSDAKLDEAGAVKSWLADVTRLMEMVFARSNTYRALHSLYEELGAYGSAACLVLDDAEQVQHLASLTAGEYYFAADARGHVTTLYRELCLTVSQVVQEFGLAQCSRAVQNLYARGALQAPVELIQGIEPRTDRNPRKTDARHMPWRSWYFEKSEDKPLRESGYKALPALCPRWIVYGGDVYGASPAMETLGDIKQLQHAQLRKAQAIDYQTNPPLMLPASFKGGELNTLPGGISFVDDAGQAGVRSAFEVRLDLGHLLADIADVRERINAGFYADLFLMLSGGERTSMTATEVAERHEEKLLMLGPVLERLHNEILDPLIDLTFERLLAAGRVPPAPQELAGRQLNVEFVSLLAQSQRALATTAVDRFVAGLGQVAQLKPEVLDKFNPDQWADGYADALGVDPDLVVAGEQVALIREQREQAQQQQAQQQAQLQQLHIAQQMQQMQQAAGQGA